MLWTYKRNMEINSALKIKIVMFDPTESLSSFEFFCSLCTLFWTAINVFAKIVQLIIL